MLGRTIVFAIVLSWLVTALPAQNLSSGDIYDLCQTVRTWRGTQGKEALDKLVACGSPEAFQSLVKVVVDKNEVMAVRWATLAALGASKSDQAGLYVIDCHKEVREEFSQSRAMLELSKAFGVYVQGAAAWAQTPSFDGAPTKDFGDTLKTLLASEQNGDLSLHCLFLLRNHPYAQVLDYLKTMAKTGGQLEQVAAVFAIASFPNGLGNSLLGDVLAEKSCPETARLAACVILGKGYGTVQGASALVLRRLQEETHPQVALYLVKIAGAFAGREALPPLDEALNRNGSLKPAYDWAVNQITTRNPSEWRWLLGLVGVVGIIGLTIIAVTYLRMPPSVIETYYLQTTGFCDLDVQLVECDMAQVLQAVVRLDKDCFVRFIRVSLLYEGQGEIAFRTRSLCIANDEPYNFVGGGTIIDDWYWNQGRQGRVLGNWYFDLRQYEGTVGTVPLMVGVLFRGDDAAPKVSLKIAGVRTDRPVVNAAVQDKSFTGSTAAV